MEDLAADGDARDEEEEAEEEAEEAEDWREAQ